MDIKQIKMARAGLGWSSKDLAAAADVGRVTVARFEGGETISDESLAKLKATLEGHGAQFARRGGRVSVSLPE